MLFVLVFLFCFFICTYIIVTLICLFVSLVFLGKISSAREIKSRPVWKLTWQSFFEIKIAKINYSPYDWMFFSHPLHLQMNIECLKFLEYTCIWLITGGIVPRPEHPVFQPPFVYFTTVRCYYHLNIVLFLFNVLN